MNFWKKYKAKKELRKKLKKARFINFYEYSIDLEDGKPISIQRYNEECGYYYETIIKGYIFLYYLNKNKGRFKKTWFYGEKVAIRDFRYKQLFKFINSAEFTELLNQYENLIKPTKCNIYIHI